MRLDDKVCHIVAAANNRFVPYLAVMLESIMQNSANNNQYRVTVLHVDIADDSVNILKSQIANFTNFSIDFIDVRETMKDYMSLYISNHIQIETYFRLLLPSLLPQVKKVVYVDCDVIANTDIYPLFGIDIGKNYLAGARDADSAANYNTDSEYKKYIDEILRLERPYDYLQAGVLVMNLEELRKFCNTEKMLNTAQSRSWKFHDQDTLNYLCKGKILFVDYAWNFVYDYNETFRRSKNIIINAPYRVYDEYLKAKENPKMIHFSWTDKPWYSPSVHYGEKFWKYARNTPFYAEMLARCEGDLGKYIICN